MLGAYWGPRKESIDQCAERALSFFEEIAKCDPALKTWRERGKSRQGALIKNANTGDRQYLIELLDRGRNKKDIGSSPINDLGFNVGLWNGVDVSLSITCGLYWSGSKSRAGLLNSIVLDLPQDLGELNRSEKMSSLLLSVVNAWTPDWAGVMAKDAMRSRNFSAQVPFVDWMLFVSRELPSSKLDPPVFRTQSGGSLIVVQADPPSDTDPKALSRINVVKEAISHLA